MSNPDAEGTPAPLELNKETLQDLDLEADDAAEVKGGASTLYIIPSASYPAPSKVALSIASRTSMPPGPSGHTSF